MRRRMQRMWPRRAAKALRRSPRKNTFKKSGPQDPATPEGEKTPRPIRGLRPSLLPVASSPSRPRKSNTAVQRGPLLTNYHNEPQVEMLSGISSPATRRIIINGSLREYYVVAGPAMSVDPMLNPHGPAYFVQPFVIRNKYVHLQASICILPPYLVNNSVPYTTNPQDITPSMYKYADASNFGLRLQYSASAVPVIQSHLGRTNDVSTLPFYLHRGMPSDDDDGAAWFRYRLLKNKQFGFKMPDSEFWWANDEEVNMYTNGEINGSHPGITLVHNPPHKTPSPYLPAHPQVAYWPIPMPVATYYPGTAPVIERTERVPSPSKRSRTASPDSERDDGRDGSLDSNPFNPAPSADTLARNGGITKDGSGSTITSSRCTSESPSKSHRHGRSPAKSNLSRAKQPKPTSSTGSQDFDFSEYLNLDAMGSSPARSNASFSQHRARQPSADSLGGHSSSGSSYIGTPSNLPLQFPPSVVPAPAVRSASSNSVDSLSQGMDVTGMMNDVFNFDTTDNYMWDKEAEDEHNGFY
ncbi:hypothetical protein BDY19DRAFT_119664 [Irpex rosettiformis]|uniref:Uncharacterized protein n=1 Tax=Irpex rosettiformis TaxID=378272 RepID=A0ACB8U5X1_9APHY|nr:hypothetical protein BDY19DRAFT_119664 [Irpex rosettiformis]